MTDSKTIVSKIIYASSEPVSMLNTQPLWGPLSPHFTNSPALNFNHYTLDFGNYNSMEANSSVIYLYWHCVL